MNGPVNIWVIAALWLIAFAIFDVASSLSEIATACG